MIYGLYLSAVGIMANSHRQDVLANNLANSETVGFKRDVALFHTRLTEAQARRSMGQIPGGFDPSLDALGGGLLTSPTHIDTTPGELEPTGSPLDVAIQGDGYFRVQDPKDKSRVLLTRNGQFMVDEQGKLVLSETGAHEVLDAAGRPIQLDAAAGAVAIGRDGAVTQDGEVVGQVGIFDAPNRSQLAKQGGTLLAYSGPQAGLRSVAPSLRAEFIERANVDPTTELAELMDAQRQLEANANMIRYQDQTLQRLVNDVGKIG